MSSRFEARTALISSVLLSLALIINGKVSPLVMAITLVFNLRVLRAVLKALPMITFYAISSIFLGGVENLLTMTALLILFLFVYGLKAEELAYALMYFRIPPRFAYAVCLSLRMLQNLSRDLNELLSLKKIENFGYFELLRRLTNLMFMRAIAMAESLESRGFDLDRKIILVRKPDLRDYVLLISSITTVFLSLL